MYFINARYIFQFRAIMFLTKAPVADVMVAMVE